jgi:hypothetical protein
MQEKNLSQVLREQMKQKVAASGPATTSAIT